MVILTYTQRSAIEYSTLYVSETISLELPSLVKDGH